MPVKIAYSARNSTRTPKFRRILLVSRKSFGLSVLMYFRKYGREPGSMSLSMSMRALLCNAADFIVVMESCELVLANNHSNYKVSFPFVLYLVCNFSYSCYAYYYCYDFPSFCSNALFCRQNARLKNCIFGSKFCRQNLFKPIDS